MRRIDWRSAAPLLLLAVLLPFVVSADRIVLKNGNVLEGKIISMDGAEVVIETGGLRQTIFTDQISEVTREADEDIGPGEHYATEARQILEAGDPYGAWQKLVEMVKAEPAAWSRNAILVRRVEKGLFDATATALDRNRYQQALMFLDALGGDATGKLWESTTTAPVETRREQLRKYYGLAYYRLGKENRTNNNRVDAQRFLRQALQFLQPGDPAYADAQYQYGSTLKDEAAEVYRAGQVERSREIVEEAMRAFGEARSNAVGDMALVQSASEELERLRDNVLPQLQRALMTPTPTPVPTATPVTPTPTPTPEPKFVESILGTQAREKMRLALNKVLPQSMDSGKALDWIVIAVLFIIGFWIVPGVILRFPAKKGGFYAEKWKKRVLFMGPFALIACLLDKMLHRPRARKGADKPCPGCGFDLADIYAYEDLDFTRCPNCRTEVEPIHSLVEYITRISNSLLIDAKQVERGAQMMTSLVEKETMQRLIRAVLTLGVRRRSSDLHIEPSSKGVPIRQRVDGIMTEMVILPGELAPAIVSALKIMGEMDITEKRRPQDGGFNIWIDGNEIDIRLTSIPASGYERMSLRMLDRRTIEMGPKKLGMVAGVRRMFEQAIHEPHGLILVTGPTGSGKSTTLYVALQELLTGDKNIVSIEDPIEFRLDGVNQIQVNTAVGLTFASGLRSILRQDPDVVMIGEIRDRETAEIAVSAANTGHLVLSTLHTIDTATCVSRLVELGVNPRQFAEALNVIMAQRLIRMICPDCRLPATPEDAVVTELNIPHAELEEYGFQEGKGCATCSKTGFFGRTGIFEMMVMNEALKTAFETRSLTTGEVREIAIVNGMKTLRHEALSLLKQGLTTADEVLRVTK
ncbi:GspE/PulE family protein [bacterium]|nr:GspE/PulE family protein [bacterium]